MIDINDVGCCGCGACVSVCPAGTLVMYEDSYGFLYPEVSSIKCINCHKCEQVCILHNRPRVVADSLVKIGCARDSEERKTGSSGGVFYSIALQILKRGG